jgi:uncharacterized protein YaaR (DUF327 family)
MRVRLQTEFGLPNDLLIHGDQERSGFSEHLKTAKNIHLKHRIDLELNTINEIGRRLSKNMSLSDLREYRQKIAEFLKMCISQGFYFKEEQFPARYGRIKILSIVKTVNEKLIDLAEELLFENRDSLKVMALIDEIRGLLLDLYS